MLDPGTAARETYEQILVQHINATYEEARRRLLKYPGGDV